MTAYTGSTPDSEPGRAWLTQAVCASPAYADKRDLWYAPKKDTADVREARQVCWSCPVLEECARWAMDTREPFGLWGGVTEGERRSALRRSGVRIDGVPDDEDEADVPEPRPAGRPRAECGTRSAYQRHVKKGEPIDAACREANTRSAARLRSAGSTKVAV